MTECSCNNDLSKQQVAQLILLLNDPALREHQRAVIVKRLTGWANNVMNEIPASAGMNEGKGAGMSEGRERMNERSTKSLKV